MSLTAQERRNILRPIILDILGDGSKLPAKKISEKVNDLIDFEVDGLNIATVLRDYDRVGKIYTIGKGYKIYYYAKPLDDEDST
ncbi:MAG: hypothetical protein LBB45_04595 [Methanobrevibacter sp.]|jgi:hypothetical protein|nr:hypothetical protein [Candidatus Methanovirga basalitermitum]